MKKKIMMRMPVKLIDIFYGYHGAFGTILDGVHDWGTVVPETVPWGVEKKMIAIFIKEDTYGHMLEIREHLSVSVAAIIYGIVSVGIKKDLGIDVEDFFSAP